MALPRIAGKYGELRLRLVFKNGRTIIKDAYNSGPLKVTKPHYLEPETGGIFLNQMCTGGGLVQGDDYYQEVELESGARLYLTTQSSTKIYRMHNGYARQLNRFRVAGFAVLEYLPEPIVPFAGSRYVGETEVHLEDDAVVFLSEIITPGRVSRGEVFQFDYFHSMLRVYWDKRLIFWNNQMLDRQSNLTRMGLYDGYTHQGSLLIFAKGVSQELTDEIHACLEGKPEILASASLTLKNGIAVRLLGNRASTLEDTINVCWGLARCHITNLPRAHVRKVHLD